MTPIYPPIQEQIMTPIHLPIQESSTGQPIQESRIQDSDTDQPIPESYADKNYEVYVTIDGKPKTFMAKRYTILNIWIANDISPKDKLTYIEAILNQYPELANAMGHHDATFLHTLISVSWDQGEEEYTKIFKVLLDTMRLDKEGSDQRKDAINDLPHRILEKTEISLKNQLTLMKSLLDKNSGLIEIRNDIGSTLVQMLTLVSWDKDEEEYAKFFKMLLDKGVSIWDKDTEGDSLIHRAIRHGRDKMVEIINEKEPDAISAITKYGYDSIAFAAVEGRWKIFSMLTEKLGDRRDNYITQRRFGKHNSNFLHIAAMGGNTQIIDFLIKKYNFDPNTKNDHGNIAAQFALIYDIHLDALKMLVTEENVNSQDNDGDTIAHSIFESVTAGNPTVTALKILYKMGANLGIRNKKNQLPYNCACAGGLGDNTNPVKARWNYGAIEWFETNGFTFGGSRT